MLKGHSGYGNASNHQNSGVQLNQQMPFCPRHQQVNTVSPGHPDPTQMMVQT